MLSILKTIGAYMVDFAQPAEPWMWVFTVGWLFALLSRKEVRSHAHWFTYFAIPFFWIWWLIPKLPIPIFKTLVSPMKSVTEIWTKVMDYSFEIKPEKFTIREVTVGAIGCAVVAGIAGGKEATGNELWRWLGFVPIGFFGFLNIIYLIVRQAGGKEAEDGVKGAPKKFWAKIWPKKSDKKEEDDPKKPKSNEDEPDDESEEPDADEEPDDESDDESGDGDGWVACPKCRTKNPPGYKFCRECAKPRLSVAPNRRSTVTSNQWKGAGRKARRKL